MVIAPMMVTLLPGSVAAAAPPQDERVRGKVVEILSRPEFSPPDPGWEERLIAALRRIFEWLGTLHETSQPLFWLILITCLTLLILLLAHIVWTVWKAFFVRRDRAINDPQREERHRLSTDYGAEARRQASLGEYTEAIRFLFLSLVYRFDESGRISFQQAYTNREYLSLFAEQPALYEQLRTFVDILDDHWYGQRPASAAQYQRCDALYRQMLQ
jgi:hypothetical protein